MRERLLIVVALAAALWSMPARADIYDVSFAISLGGTVHMFAIAGNDDPTDYLDVEVLATKALFFGVFDSIETDWNRGHLIENGYVSIGWNYTRNDAPAGRYSVDGTHKYYHVTQHWYYLSSYDDVYHYFDFYQSAPEPRVGDAD